MIVAVLGCLTVGVPIAEDSIHLEYRTQRIPSGSNMKASFLGLASNIQCE